MSFTSNFDELQKKKRKKTGHSFTDTFDDLMFEKMDANLTEADIAPVRTNTNNEKEEEKEEKRSWFNKVEVDSVGDVFKTIIGSSQDVSQNISAGIYGIGEKAIDTGAYLAGAVGGLFGADEFQDKMGEFVKKDLYNEEEWAKRRNLLTGGIDIGKIAGLILGVDVEEDSVFGEKSDSLAQSGGQLLGTMALQAVGVPWFVTSGVTSFGSEAEAALGEGATYEQAGVSAAIATGAELLSEKLFGGSGLGEKGLINLEPLTKALTGKAVKVLADFGIDALAEGGEEIFSEFLSTLGQQLTYEKEATWREILTNEDAAEKFIADTATSLFGKEALSRYGEAAIGGMALGGFANVGKVPSHIKQGRDYRSGLTVSEQSVVDKVYKDAVAKAEKDGKKLLTDKERAEIREKVLKDLERGTISTDAIEEVLGGEAYKTYKDAVAEEESVRKEIEAYNNETNAILKEFEELGEKTTPTLKERSRYAVLEERINNINNSTVRDELQAKLEGKASIRADLRTKLNEEMSWLQKGSKLGESYRDAARRTQKYTADVSQYKNENARKTVQNAIDSGFMNNGVDAHDFVDFAAKLAEARGYEVVFADSKGIEAMKAEYDLKADAKRIEGFNSGKTKKIIVNMEANKSWASIVGHEFTDTVREAGHFEALRDAAKAYAEAKGEYQAKLDSVKRRYAGIEADIEGEVTSDIVGEYLSNDYDFVKNLHANNRNVFQKIYDEIKYLYKLATAGSKEARQLEKMKHNFEKVMRESKGAESKGETKYSLAETTDGRIAAVVDSDILSNIDTNTWDKTKKEAAKEAASEALKQFKGGIVVDGITRKVNRTSRREYTRSNDTERLYNNAPDIFADKMRAADVADDIVVAATNWNRDGGLVHPRDDNFVDFDHGQTLIAAGNAKYSAEVVVGITDNGDAVFYDVVDMTPTNFDIKKAESSTTATTQDAIGDINEDSVSPIVPQEGDVVNSEFENSSENGDISYSLSEDSEGRELSPSVKNRFAKSKVVDENGSLKVVYHGTATGEFTIFDKTKGSVEGDFGSGFYFTDNEADVSEHYEGGGPDFDNKVGRRADEIWGEEPDIEYEEAERRAREELFKGSHKFEVYLNIENPAIVGETVLFDQDSYLEEYNEEDYDDYDDYIGEVEQLLADDVENIIWEIERNVDVDRTDGIADVLYEAYYEGGIGLEELKKKINNLYLENSNGELVGNEVTRQIIESLGYDGIIDPTVSGKWNMDIEEGTTHYIVFKPNQIKAVTNASPTDNPDIHKSLSTEEGVAPTGQTDYNAAMRYNAPVREDLTGATETVSATENTTAKENVVESEFEGNMPEGFAPVTEEEATALARDNLASLTEADMPPEVEAPYYESTDTTRIDDKALENISKSLAETLALDAKETEAIGDVVQRYSTGEIGEAELFDEIQSKFGERRVEYADEGVAEVKRELKKHKIRVSPDIKGDFPNYNAFMKSNFGKIRFSKDGLGVDQVYQEMSELYPDYFPSDIINPADQLAVIAEVANYDTTLYEAYSLSNEEIQEAADLIASEVGKYKEASVMENAEADRQALMNDIAPVKESAPKERYEAIRPKKQSAEPRMKRVDSKDAQAESKVAEVYDTEPEVAKKKSRGWSKFKTNFLDKGSVFEDLSLKTKNRELMGKWNHTLSSESRAQWMIGNGANGVKSLNDIRAEVEGSGLTKQFYEYLYHKHNADRMNLEGRYENIKNKPVFGYDVTAEMSQDTANKLEKENPEFKAYADDVYTYMNHLRSLMVENGVISQETADLWAEMYPHYVPIRRLGDSGLNINVPLDTGRTGVNAPIKRATGGNRDILPLFDTMALRTEQTFKAIAKNSFGVELKNTLGTTIESDATNIDEVIEGVEKHEDLLKKGENGKNPTFTVFEDGKKVTFEITEDMYDAMKPTSEFFASTNKVLNKASNFHRGLLTEYNPTFMVTNAIKDVQDVLINSQHATKTYANMPTAIGELLSKGKWYTEYMQNGGEQNTYFDGETNSFTKDKSGFSKVIGFPLDAISKANNFIERVPRLAEYIASRKNGASVEVAMLDAARVTTNFAAGGDVTKFLNRNGATFLDASVQGAMQQVRNVREAKANGLKGWVQLATKFAVGGFAVALLNHLMWEDDEEYEELSDYVKQNYYIVAKYGDGQFVRIPKGRTLAVIQNAFEQVINAATGDDEVDFESFWNLVKSNLAPNNPFEDNIIAPIIQVANNKTWYGDDLVPTRLQDLPAAEQYDESTDGLSKWLGETLNVSPYKINYLLDQYLGGVGDVLLPMWTPEAERGDDSFLGNMIAPLKDKFTTDSTMNNQNVSDFYDTVDKLTTNAKSSKATDEDVLKYKYMNAINAELGELYKQKREIQNSNLSNAEKYEAVYEIQEKINSLARESLATYENVNIDNGYATIGDLHYRWYEPSEDSDAEAGWQKISDKQLEKQNKVTRGLGISASEYWSNKEEYDFAYEYPAKYEVAKAVGGYSTYKTYSSELYDIKADKDSEGKSISGSRKEKVIDYVNSLDIDYGEKLILFKSEYNADDTYNYEIIEYLNSRSDISYKQMETILKELGFKVDSKGNITWD